MATLTLTLQEGDKTFVSTFSDFTAMPGAPIPSLERLALTALLQATQSNSLTAQVPVYGAGLERTELHPDFVYGYLCHRLAFARVSMADAETLEVQIPLTSGACDLWSHA